MPEQSFAPFEVIEKRARVEPAKDDRQQFVFELVLVPLESGALKPIIDRVFTFDEMRDVHRYLEQNGQFGKIVVTV